MKKGKEKWYKKAFWEFYVCMSVLIVSTKSKILFALKMKIHLKWWINKKNKTYERKM